MRESSTAVLKLVRSPPTVPLYVKGERYGCVCLGWDPERLRA